jgi:SM-20-related protein
MSSCRVPALIPSDSLQRAVAALRGVGWIVLEDFVSDELASALSAELDALQSAQHLQRAGTGRGSAPDRSGGLRGDSIRWLEPGVSPVQDELFAVLDAWRLALNRELWLGLEDVEAHYACYPPGAGYARHRDRFRDDDARVLSLVLYLNRDWVDDDGGQLRLHLDADVHDVAPRLGHAVLFLSADLDHEVMPARRERRSIAGWFRRRMLASGGR